jgi:hypothetical protein
MKLPVYMILQYVKQIGTAVYQWCGVGFRRGKTKIKKKIVGSNNLTLMTAGIIDHIYNTLN